MPDAQPLHDAILRVLEICNREIRTAAVPGAWRTVQDMLHRGLVDAKCSMAPTVHVTVWPGVAYRTIDPGKRPVFSFAMIGRSDRVRSKCEAAYKALPTEDVEYMDSDLTHPKERIPSCRVGEVVEVQVLIDVAPQPDNGPPATAGCIYQGTYIENDGDYGVVRP